jgi:hypothetical protein
MGYEIKLFVGRSSHGGSEEVLRSKVAVLEDDVAYFPYERTEDGGYRYTGRTEIYFQVYGMVALCSPGRDSHLLKLNWKNKESARVCWKFYNGNTEIKEDCYGDIAKPVPVADVIEALEKDFEASKGEYAGEGYRRFRWALGFLKAVDKDSEVMLYGN